MNGRPPMITSKKKALNVSGEIIWLNSALECDISFDGIQFKGKCYLTNRPNLNLLGLDWIEKLVLLELPLNNVCNIMQSSRLSPAKSKQLAAQLLYNLQEKFASVFQDGLSCCTKTKVTSVASYLAPALELALAYLAGVRFPSYVDPSTFRLVPFPRLQFFWADTECEIQPTLVSLFHYLLDEPVNGFIGPVCTFPLASATRITGARFKRPLVTYGGSEVDFADKRQYPLLTRLGGHHGSLKGFLYTVFTYFGWKPRGYKNVALLHVRVSEESQVSAQVRAASTSAFYAAKAILSEGMRFRVEGIITEHDNFADMKARILQLSLYGRIVILCADPDAVRQLMLIAYDLGFVNGEYVFFNIDLLSSTEQQKRPWYRASASAEENRKAREAYRVLMTVTLRKPDSPQYLAFTKEVQRRAKHDYNYTYVSNEVEDRIFNVAVFYIFPSLDNSRHLSHYSKPNLFWSNSDACEK
ncbi:unnamed protein product [Schistocephalus solidus]|uniref:ANF_receptor domain-containing protein n=1 Tax=Schistocephalus solidus TaxID=70667 RepID=A0A183SVL2_SCHSO|nr:unnamed protein product [Schistocephalus solidus]